ncbi:xylitol dehydrogenase [Pisolithus croceorrhizus]|nr:xylitol dehydrogenase [Pisolithus croceorrhizus]KAI6163037.1 xylitol dehydrogenase [Pisolithus thermaeus]
MSDNLSFVLKKVNTVTFEQRPIPDIGPHEVLVEVKKTGICGSDVHYLLHGRIGDFVLENGKDMVLGHESSGVIAKVGSLVSHLKPGDRVSIEPGATCRTCAACKEGRYELCPNVRFAAAPPVDGTLGRYYAVPSDLAYPLPSGLSLEDGAMIEPLSVAVHAVAKLGNFRTSQSIAIFGCGPVGLLCMAVAKAFGASRVIAIDIVPHRLEFAKSYAATDTFMPPLLEQGETNVEFSKRAAALMKAELGIAEQGAQGIDLVVDASGAETSIQTGIRIVKTGGTYVEQVGLGQTDVTIDMSTVVCKQLTVKGSFRYGPGDYPLAISLVARGRVDLRPLVSHRFSFQDAHLAFETARNGKGIDGKGVIKTIISGPGVEVSEL